MSPIESAMLAAEKLTDPQTQSKLIGKIAQTQAAAGNMNDAYKTFRKMNPPDERRIPLLVTDWQSLTAEDVPALVELLELSPQTASLAGRLAEQLVHSLPNGLSDATFDDTRNRRLAAAWKLIETAQKPFESEEQRFKLFSGLLEWTNFKSPEWAKIDALCRSFTDDLYRDWAAYTIVTHLHRHVPPAKWEKADTEYADRIPSPLRRAWCYYVMQKYSKAKEIIETIILSADKQEEAETAAIASRIIGDAADKEMGTSLLERSESAAAMVKVPMTRYRLQCFLGKVLKERGDIKSVEEYLPIDNMLASLSHLDQSKAAVWLAEAGWEKGWTAAVKAAAVPMRGIPEADRADRIAEILQRYAYHRAKPQPSDDPKENEVLLSGEEFERRYFSPFSRADCGC